MRTARARARPAMRTGLAHAHRLGTGAEHEVVDVLGAGRLAVAHRVELADRAQALGREERALVSETLEERERVPPFQAPLVTLLAFEEQDRMLGAQQTLAAAEHVELVALDV